MITLALLLATAPAEAVSAPSVGAPVKGPALKSVITLERIHADPPLDGTAPTALSFSPGGKFLAFLRANAKDSDVLDLWGVRLPDGKPELLVATDDLLQGATQKLTEAEKMALERKRISKRGITDYLWCGDKGDALLFPLSGDLYRAQLGAPGAKPSVERLTRDDDVPELVPQCSTSGTKVVFTKKGNVVVLDSATKKERTLTKGANDARTFGLAEFIAEEEMDRHDGTWWAPDEKQLLVFEVDESAVGKKTRAQIFADRTEMFEQRYPAAGEKNANVRAHLIDVASGRDVILETPREDGYLARAGFFPDGTAWVQWQSRDQRVVKLLETTARGKAQMRVVFEEKDSAWVELTDDLHALPDGALVWSTEAGGMRQLVLVDRKSGARKIVTTQAEPVNALLGVDEAKRVAVFSGYTDRGRQLHVFTISLDGGNATQVTTGEGWHDAVVDDSGRFFTDKASTWGVPPTVTLRDITGKALLVVDDNPAAELRAFKAPNVRWLDVTAADGQTTLNALLLEPARAVSPRTDGPGGGVANKVPVIAALYGGPGAQTVVKRWARSFPLYAYWAQRGYAVLLVDNRGMAGRDRAFTRAHQNAFGQVEVDDVKATLAQLPKLAPWVDAKRVGMFGWSYGGFLAARMILDDKTPFACVAAGAPVTDWTLYDTHYTERYIGMPVVDGKPNPTYTTSNLSARVPPGRASVPLLLLHGTADDNVLFEHSLRLIEALQKQSTAFDTAIYPGKAHGVSGKAAQLHVQRTVTGFFDRCLK